MRRKHRRGFGQACSRDSRLLRGTVGFFLGSIVGSVVGGIIALPFAAGADKEKAPMVVIAPAALSLIGAGAGIYIGARKPEC